MQTHPHIQDFKACCQKIALSLIARDRDGLYPLYTKDQLVSLCTAIDSIEAKDLQGSLSDLWKRFMPLGLNWTSAVAARDNPPKELRSLAVCFQEAREALSPLAGTTVADRLLELFSSHVEWLETKAKEQSGQ
jgi:hypothetical protein